MTNVAHKSSATWERCVACGAGHETVLYCAIYIVLYCAIYIYI